MYYCKGEGVVGPSIKYVRKIFQKTNISNSQYAHVRVRIRGLDMLVFRKVLRTYLMNDFFDLSTKENKKNMST